MNLVLIPVVTFYLLCDWERLVKGCKNLLPKKAAPTMIKLSIECDRVLGAFFRGQLLVMLFLAVFFSIGLSLIGINIGIILGILIGIISIVPYLGMIVGITASSIAAYVEFGTLQSVLLVWVVFGIGQFLESFIVTPRLVGDRIGLHPIVVIFAILAGGCLFGFFGVLLALPVAAVIMVWLRFLMKRYHESPLYQ
jgi:predicted PurR-regulated permease PerM